jgi:hypothetical protein
MAVSRTQWRLDGLPRFLMEPLRACEASEAREDNARIQNPELGVTNLTKDVNQSSACEESKSAPTVFWIVSEGIFVVVAVHREVRAHGSSLDFRVILLMSSDGKNSSRILG